MDKNIFSNSAQLIVMLTCHDLTVDNAEEIFERCKDSSAQLWGMKEIPLPLDRMKALFARMKACGKTTVLEVVSYDEAGAMHGAQVAAECGCDIVMGTKFHRSVMDFLHRHGILYMPFVGTIEGRPSVLSGAIDDILAEARQVLSQGADGIDLLGYRYTGDAPLLNKTLAQGIDAPLCIAGSIDCDQRLNEVYNTGAWAFTIGSAFFAGRFNGTFAEQIDHVCDHINHLRPADA